MQGGTQDDWFYVGFIITEILAQFNKNILNLVKLQGILYESSVV